MLLRLKALPHGGESALVSASQPGLSHLLHFCFMPSCFLECMLESSHPWRLAVGDIGHVTHDQTQLVLSSLQATLSPAHLSKSLRPQTQPCGVLTGLFANKALPVLILSPCAFTTSQHGQQLQPKSLSPVIA